MQFFKPEKPCFAAMLSVAIMFAPSTLTQADDAPVKAAAKDASPSSAAAALRLVLPPQCFAVVGQEFRIDFGNILNGDTKQEIRFTVDIQGVGKNSENSTAHGAPSAKRFAWTPPAEAVGIHRTSVTVHDVAGKLIDQATTELCVAPASAAADRELTLLIVGDSLTHATLYPNEWARLLSLPGNPKWTMLGTHRPAAAAPGVAHEGYGGWQWRTFVSHYAPKPDPAKRIRSSPFVFVGDDGKPRLDLPRYFRESCGGRSPDVVTFLLGINDCFAAPADDAAALDRHIDGVLAQADLLLAAFQAAAPKAKLAVCLTPPPNARDEAFVANYKDKYPRSGWVRIQHRLVERQLKHFGGREKERIFVVPTQLDLDVVDGYPENNGVHPNAAGYARIAATLHAWLKWQLHLDSTGP
jgi:lysophospholipase L1-like esterase